MQFSNTINMEVEPVSRLRSHFLGVEAVQFNPVNPNEMMSASHDERILFWDVPTQKVIREVKLNGKGIWAAEYSPDGKSVIAGTSSTKLFTVPAGSKTFTEVDLSADIHTITSLAYSPDGRTLAVSGSSQKAVFLDSQKHSKKISEVGTPKEHSNSMVFNPTGQFCLMSFYTGGFCVTDTSDITQPAFLFANSYNNLIEASYTIRFRGKDEFFLSDSDGFVRLYRFDKSTFTPLFEKFCHYQAVKSLELITEKGLIFTGSRVLP